MPVREQCDVTLSRARSGDDPIRSDTHLLRRLTARTAVAKNQPARPGLVDLCRGQPLIFAVIPLGQVGVVDGLVAEARQFASLTRALHGAAEDERKYLSGEHRLQ